MRASLQPPLEDEPDERAGYSWKEYGPLTGMGSDTSFFRFQSTRSADTDGRGLRPVSMLGP